MRSGQVLGDQGDQVTLVGEVAGHGEDPGVVVAEAEARRQRVGVGVVELDPDGASVGAHGHRLVESPVGDPQVVELTQRRTREEPQLGVVPLALELGDHHHGQHHLVLREPFERPRVGQQHAGVEDEGPHRRRVDPRDRPWSCWSCAWDASWDLPRSARATPHRPARAPDAPALTSRWRTVRLPEGRGAGPLPRATSSDASSCSGRECTRSALPVAASFPTLRYAGRYAAHLTRHDRHARTSGDRQVNARRARQEPRRRSRWV